MAGFGWRGSEMGFELGCRLSVDMPTWGEKDDGWWMVEGGWWMVDGGWWMVDGGWRSQYIGNTLGSIHG